jgi:hypothetical protein
VGLVQVNFFILFTTLLFSRNNEGKFFISPPSQSRNFGSSHKEFQDSEGSGLIMVRHFPHTFRKSKTCPKEWKLDCRFGGATVGSRIRSESL